MGNNNRTSDERRLDHEIDSMNAYWRTGWRFSNWASWQDGGMTDFYADQESESGCKGLEGAELRDAVLGMEDAAMGFALGLSEDVVSITLEELRDRSQYEVETESLAGSRLVFDNEREVLVAVSPAGIRSAGLRVRSDSEGGRIRYFEFGPIEPWVTGTSVRKSINGPAGERRRSHRACDSCEKPFPPEDRIDSEDRRTCLGCAGEPRS